MPESAVPAEIYLNGVIQPRGTAMVSIDDHGILFGLGFFETFRTCRGRPHHWTRHRERLLAACTRAHIELPSMFLVRNEAYLECTISRLLKRNRLTEGVGRYTITAGPLHKGRYINPSEFLTLHPLPRPAPQAGVVLRVLRLARDSGEWLPRPKSINFGNVQMGALELRTRSTVSSDEGLFLSREGQFVVEAVRHNLAWFVGEQIYYPEPNLGAVAGTCLAWALGYFPQARPSRAKLSALARADAIVLLNTVRGVTPVSELRDQADSIIWRRQSTEPRGVRTLVQNWSAELEPGPTR